MLKRYFYNLLSTIFLCRTFIFLRYCIFYTYLLFHESLALSLCQLCLSCISIFSMCCSSYICMSAWLMLFPIVSCSMAAFRDKSINKWQRMTQVTTDAAAIKGKLYAFNQVMFCDWTQNSTIRCTDYFTPNLLYCCRISVIKLLLIWEIPVE
jgi:hypothetical protein